ncbi:hypothetical protein TTE0699 [Caldanaerobacter subterraneus subsp. tengcongensis MB4]|uniref:Uncharacterized protein n=1 Tax=Caldanaerobacter subterraneus subsp. tengcongensis (strain DSM 15242 / JCM 11007 / NBRC 100824 / MB4) TaxID=273068 RepID=Q8RBV9_CALS4|nr:hypothetical protein TTE0699 [Caldanaerobacter subterraneus subsp. tengcongensis MB4]
MRHLKRISHILIIPNRREAASILFMVFSSSMFLQLFSKWGKYVYTYSWTNIYKILDEK